MEEILHRLISSHYLQGLYIPGGCLGFLPSTVASEMAKVLENDWFISNSLVTQPKDHEIKV